MTDKHISKIKKIPVIIKFRKKGGGTIAFKGIKCVKKDYDDGYLDGKKAERENIILLFKKEMNEMIEDDDCYGYKEHKTLTLNTVYKYPIEGESISLTMLKLKHFAEESYRNGWLEALNHLNKLLEKINGDDDK